MNQTYEDILLEVNERVATITLNRPEKLNAWTPTMGHSLQRALADCAADNEVRAIVITGAGRGFCAGADMGVLQQIQTGAAERATPAAPVEAPLPPERTGLVQRALPADVLLAETLAYARDLCETVSPRSMAVMKAQIWKSPHQDFNQALAVADSEMKQSFASEDFREGVAHYLEKRAPRFNGR